MAGKTIAFFPEAAFGPALNSVGIAQATEALGHKAVFLCDPGFTGVFAGYGFPEHHVPMSEPMPAEEMAPIDEHDPAFEALHKETRERAAELGERRGLPEEVVHQVLDSVTEPGKFADLVAGYIELSVAEKQGLLETLNVEERVRRVLVHHPHRARGAGRRHESQHQQRQGHRARARPLRRSPCARGHPRPSASPHDNVSAGGSEWIRGACGWSHRWRSGSPVTP